MENMTCPKCGKNVPTNAKFCPSCGHTLNEAMPSVSQKQDVTVKEHIEQAWKNSEQGKKCEKTNKILYAIDISVTIIICVFLLVVVIYLSMIWGQDDFFGEGADFDETFKTIVTLAVFAVVFSLAEGLLRNIDPFSKTYIKYMNDFLSKNDVDKYKLLSEAKREINLFNAPNRKAIKACPGFYWAVECMFVKDRPQYAPNIKKKLPFIIKDIILDISLLILAIGCSKVIIYEGTFTVKDPPVLALVGLIILVVDCIFAGVLKNMTKKNNSLVFEEKKKYFDDFTRG